METMTRTERAEAALAAYREAVGPGLSDGEYITDLMADLLHLADELHNDDEGDSSSAESIHEWALIHFEAERGDR